MTVFPHKEFRHFNRGGAAQRQAVRCRWGGVIMLGLKHGINLLVDYDPQWPIAFAAEKARIHSAVGTVARGIEHYGSTAVLGLRAKPILDILVGVAPLEAWIQCKLPLERLGYDYAEHAGIAGHFIFGRG